MLHCPHLKARIAYCVEGENLLDTVRYTFNLPLRQPLSSNYTSIVPDYSISKRSLTTVSSLMG
jgi:hypothetical protein